MTVLGISVPVAMVVIAVLMVLCMLVCMIGCLRAKRGVRSGCCFVSDDRTRHGMKAEE